jgi:hypothetical protein
VKKNKKKNQNKKIRKELARKLAYLFLEQAGAISSNNNRIMLK